MRTRARRLKRTHGLGLLIVDYLQLLAASGKSRQENRVQEVSEITRGLKTLAKELDVPVLALSQLSRAVEQREDKRPQLADLRESGSIEQDADVVMFVYREEYYLTRSEPSRRAEESDQHFNERHDDWKQRCEQTYGKAEVIIAKQRHGPTGIVRLSFEGQFTKFGNLAADADGPGPVFRVRSSRMSSVRRQRRDAPGRRDPHGRPRRHRRQLARPARCRPRGRPAGRLRRRAQGRRLRHRRRRSSGRGSRPKAAGSSSSPISRKASPCAASCPSTRSTC